MLYVLDSEVHQGVCVSGNNHELVHLRYIPHDRLECTRLFTRRQVHLGERLDLPRPALIDDGRVSPDYAVTFEPSEPARNGRSRQPHPSSEFGDRRAGLVTKYAKQIAIHGVEFHPTQSASCVARKKAAYSLPWFEDFSCEGGSFHAPDRTDDVFRSLGSEDERLNESDGYDRET